MNLSSFLNELLFRLQRTIVFEELQRNKVYFKRFTLFCDEKIKEIHEKMWLLDVHLPW